MKNDRSMAGALSGGLASVIQQIYGALVHYFGISEKDFGDFAGVLVMSRNFQGIYAHVVQWTAHIAIGMGLGIVFAQFFRYSSSKFWWLKGVIYGAILWVLLTGVGTLFKMPVFSVIRPVTAISILLGSLVYGLASAYFMKLLDKSTNLI